MRDYKQRAAELIEQMKTDRPTCDNCDHLSFDAAEQYFLQSELIVGRHRIETYVRSQVHEAMTLFGFEHEVLADRYTRRCRACANAKLYPWANRLDVERVAHMLEHDERCRVCDLGILSETLLRNQAGELIGPNDEVPSPAPLTARELAEKVVARTDLRPTRGFEFL